MAKIDIALYFEPTKVFRCQQNVCLVPLLRVTYQALLDTCLDNCTCVEVLSDRIEFLYFIRLIHCFWVITESLLSYSSSISIVCKYYHIILLRWHFFIMFYVVWGKHIIILILFNMCYFQLWIWFEPIKVFWWWQKVCSVSPLGILVVLGCSKCLWWSYCKGEQYLFFSRYFDLDL